MTVINDLEDAWKGTLVTCLKVISWCSLKSTLEYHRNPYDVLTLPLPHFEEVTSLRVFENRVLRRVFGSKRDEVGAKRVVCGPEGARLADNRVRIKLRKRHSFLPSPIHACPRHGPWATS